ncbi:protein DMP8-like [Miscanthus floridulus]|uniref:protein DMP8-like n=1 Tax=Miscanthus floridulus TaxID=154761 RepID=UPI0034585C0D
MDRSNVAAAGAVSVDVRGCGGSPPAGAGGRKRRLVARGVQSTLSKTSMLANFLPTGTLLTFEMLLPAASGDGTCSAVSVAMLRALLALCAASCFLSHFTDSFRAPYGKVYYGFVTPRGLSLFRTGLGVEVPREERYWLAFVDVVHAVMSVLVFAAVALADYRVSGCLVAGHRKEMDEVMESCPLMVGTVCSGLFLVLPNTRYGIGCLAA